MSRGIERGIVAVILCLASAAWCAAQDMGADFYVATDGNDAWSGRLDRPNASHTDGPFASLTRARDAVRGVIAGELDHDIVVAIHGGRYVLPDGIRFSADDSGTTDCAIVYTAYPDEQAVLVGGVELKNWTRDKDQIWKAPLPEGVETAQLFENGRRLTLAPAPEVGYYRIDPQNRVVYAWPLKEPIERESMVVSTAPSLVALSGGGPDRPLRNVHLVGIDLSIANGNVVGISSAVNCSVSFGLIENGLANGVEIVRNAEGMMIYGCLIRENGRNGVSISGLPPGEGDANGGHVVANNHIRHCGRLQGDGDGVRIYQSGRNQITNNHIHDMPCHGVSIKGNLVNGLQNIEGATPENRYHYLYSNGNTIACNHIHDVNRDGRDTGAIESWGGGRDNVIDHNLIHDGGNAEIGLQSGIFLDDGAGYFTVTHNIIYGIAGAGSDQPIFAKGTANRIENNVLVVGAGNRAGITSQAAAGAAAAGQVYRRNIIIFEGDGGAIYRFIDWSEDRVAISDDNVFWKPAGTLTVEGGPADGSFEKWKQVLGGKFDARSLTADPKFFDAARRDYRLRADSPALTLGIESIDTSQIGFRDDFPKRFERD